MEIEELICERCDTQWNRAKARGRKPKLCPQCTVSDSPILSSITEEEDQLIDPPLVEEAPPIPTKYKPNTKWKCHSCGAKVQIGVGINEPPTHKCPKKLKRVLPLEQL